MSQIIKAKVWQEDPSMNSDGFVDRCGFAMFQSQPDRAVLDFDTRGRDATETRAVD